MRRVALFCVALGVAAGAVGCRSTVCGTHDCTYSPEANTLPPTSGQPAYTTVGEPISGPGVAPKVAEPMPMAPMSEK
jgi:hypothetical protein